MAGKAPEADNEFDRGWPVILAAFAGIMTGIYAMPFYIIGPLARPLEAAFGWDRVAIFTASSCLSLGQFLGTPIAGRLTDRFGPRRVAVTSMVILTLGMAALALNMRDINTFRLGYLALGFVCAGSGPVSFTRAIGAWFQRARGFALGCALAGTGASAFLAPLLIQLALEHGGWRNGMLAVSALTALAIPVVLFGLRPARAQPLITGPEPASTVVGMSWTETLKDPRFHLIGLALVLMSLFIAGLVLHTTPMLIDEGLSPLQAAGIASLNGVSLLAGRVMIGWLLDRVAIAWLALLMFVSAAGGCMALVLGGPAAAPVMVLGLGFMIGAEVDLLSFIVARYFGLKNYGVIYGALFTACLGSALISPWVTGALVKLGGYPMLFSTAAATFVLVGLIFALSDRMSSPSPLLATS